MSSRVLRIITAGMLLCGALVGAAVPANAQDRGAQQTEKRETGYAAHKPVVNAPGEEHPWGVVGTVVKEAMASTGWDILLCRTCGGGALNVRNVVAAAVPPKPAPGSTDPTSPDGPLDFGVTGSQFLWWAYQGTHEFAKDPGTPQKQLRLVANIQDPSYMLIAVKAGSGITDLRQIKDKRLPVKVLVLSQGGDTIAGILTYYGLSKEALASWGGKLLGTTAQDQVQNEAKDPDVIIGFGKFVRPENDAWIDISERVDLKFLELPKDLKTKLVKDYDLQEVTVPVALFRGVDHAFSGVGRSGEVVYGRTDMPDGFAYTLAKALDEHKDLLQWTNVTLSYNPQTVWKCFGVPLHPGAARYYREKGYMK